MRFISLFVLLAACGLFLAPRHIMADASRIDLLLEELRDGATDQELLEDLDLATSVNISIPHFDFGKCGGYHGSSGYVCTDNGCAARGGSCVVKSYPVIGPQCRCVIPLKPIEKEESLVVE